MDLCARKLVRLEYPGNRITEAELDTLVRVMQWMLPTTHQGMGRSMGSGGKASRASKMLNWVCMGRAATVRVR